MKKVLSLILFAFITIAASAQAPLIGILSYDAALKSMPDYALAQQKINDLRAQYDAEMKTAEKEFSQKYELFLDQQAGMNTAIREKRQSELQLMMERNVAFRAESQRLLAKAEKEALAPLNEKLNAAIEKIGNERGIAVIVNTDNNAVPFINPSMVTDLNEDIKALLK